ncbi:MAG: hypothetical protein CMJ80_12945 [Planctomycetaceae bacterium]|nr:hypothetical protein [Planctomycetaceae bacterium]
MSEFGSETNDDILVSFIVLAFNRKKETIKCLDSIMRQHGCRKEVIVLDNCSTDGVVEAIEEQFSDVRVLRMPKNYGDWEGRSIAACNATGSFYVFVDNDGFLSDNSTEIFLSEFAQDKCLAVAQAKVIDPDNLIPEGTGGNRSLAEVDHYRHTFLGGAAMIRADLYHKIGGFPHYLLGGGEPFVAYRLLDLGFRIKHCSKAILFHKKSPEGRVPAQRLFLSAKQRLRALLSHYPGIFRPASELCWKTSHYTFLALRNGSLFRLPSDVCDMIFSGLRSWRGDWIIDPSTVKLVDYLKTNVVCSVNEYVEVVEALKGQRKV